MAAHVLTKPLQMGGLSYNRVGGKILSLITTCVNTEHLHKSHMIRTGRAYGYTIS